MCKEKRMEQMKWKEKKMRWATQSQKYLFNLLLSLVIHSQLSYSIYGLHFVYAKKGAKRSKIIKRMKNHKWREWIEMRNWRRKFITCLCVSWNFHPIPHATITIIIIIVTMFLHYSVCLCVVDDEVNLFT
jgi:hypothetical protein